MAKLKIYKCPEQTKSFTKIGQLKLAFYIKFNTEKM